MKKILLLILVGLFLNSFGQTTAEKDFIKWAKKNAQELPLNYEANKQAFEAIGKAIGEAQFVGISEGLHNTREFITMNVQLIKYLVEKKGFTRLVGETGFPESSFANAYINGADIPKEEWTAGINKMYSRWKEFNKIIEWLREHNRKVSDDKKVQFYGLDITGGYHDLMPPFNIINHYLEKVDPAYSKRFSAKLLPYLEVLKSKMPRQARNRFVEKLLLEQKYDFELELNLAIKHITANKEIYLTKSDLKEYDFIRQSCISFFYAISYYINSGNRSNADYNQTVGINGREINMFESFQWVHRQDTTAKIIIINHNIHSKTKSRYFNKMWRFLTPFGAFVRQEFGDKYYAIGVSYGTGVWWENWTKNEERHITNTKTAKQGSLDFTMKQVGLPYFFINFQSVPQNRQAYKWLSQETILNDPEDHFPLKPNEFDGMIFFESISVPTDDQIK